MCTHREADGQGASMSGERRRLATVLVIVAFTASILASPFGPAPAAAAENEWFTSDGAPKAAAINATMRSLVESFRWHLFGLSWDGSDHPEMPTHAGFVGAATPVETWVTGTTFDRQATEATLRSLVEVFRWHFWGISWDGNPHPEVPTHAGSVAPPQGLDPWFDATGAVLPANVSATLQSLVEAFRWHFWGISWDGNPHSELPTHATRIGQPARVIHVVDGDTIDVDINGTIQRVRLIGIDTPEIHGDVQCFGPEAAAYTTARLLGQTVGLEKDVSETDKYGRLLRYVWLGDELLNETLVREGYASVSTYPPDVKYAERFLAAQQEAQSAGRGLWGGCSKVPGSPTPVPGAPTPTPTPTPTPSPTPPRQGCDPAYPTVCIPSPPPDLDCTDIPYRGFTVRPPDPHRFDSDGDGIGCER